MNSTAQASPRWFGVAAVVVSLGFAAFTLHAWEDYFITFRASLNLATGNGLVFQRGERVHTFTSPLGTLLPALFAIGGGEGAPMRALWGLRLVSALALGATLWMAIRAFQRDSLARVAVVTAGLALVIDPKIVDFAMNGMETGLIVLLVVFTWRTFSHAPRLWPGALGFAGLQWTRPDGFIYFGAIALGWLVFGAPNEGSWRKRLILVVQMVAVGGAIYLPWFVFAWTYYGSPVPHTIVAKAQSLSLREIASLLGNYPWKLILGHVALHDVFRPTYHFFGGWPEPFGWLGRILATGAAVAWLWSRVAPAGRMASLAFFLGGFYVAYIPPFPWYYPGWQALGWIAWAYLLHGLWGLQGRLGTFSHAPQAITRIAAALIVLLQAGLFACVAWQMRVQQRLIETGHRREIGRWLARAAGAGDRVYLECLGYIGFFSGLKMLDYPGLCSPEVVAARRAGHRTLVQVIDALRPEWVVLRPFERDRADSEMPTFNRAYRLVRVFDTQEAVDAIRLLPGRNYLNIDAVFLIYRRADPAPVRE